MGNTLLVVCEDNYYAQSTPQSVNLAGSISARAEAFEIKTFDGNTWDVTELLNKAQAAISYVRSKVSLLFFTVRPID
jgi:TPP-dependent pyruvate/acetoin dehydrogenase alpha subunit